MIRYYNKEQISKKCLLGVLQIGVPQIHLCLLAPTSDKNKNLRHLISKLVLMTLPRKDSLCIHGVARTLGSWFSNEGIITGRQTFLCSKGLNGPHKKSMKRVVPSHFISWKKSLSDISRNWILPNMIRAGIANIRKRGFFFHEIKNEFRGLYPHMS